MYKLIDLDNGENTHLDNQDLKDILEAIEYTGDEWFCGKGEAYERLASLSLRLKRLAGKDGGA